jgi:hypothetical protein
VIYNISESRWRAAFDAAARACGVDGAWCGSTWHEASGRWAVQYSGLSALRNISVQLDAFTGGASHQLNQLETALDRQLGRMEQLPSVSGACLTVLGLALLVVPAWMLSRHANDVASAVAGLLR